MANEDKGQALTSFWPQYLIPMFAAQRTITPGQHYDSCGTCQGIRLFSSGTVVVTFEMGKQEKRMAITAGGWGWL